MERGTLRIYLGAAPGVGKTYAMLGEARRRRDRGADVVVGIVETHGRSATAEQLGDLEVIPRRSLEYRGTTLSELDVDAVLARRPDAVVIDEFAHTNAPGSANPKRWQDVEQLLAAGIDVVTTVNIQHLESLNDVVAQITGVVQAETVPDRVVRAADQIELVDMSPEALRRRMAHGNIYPPERADAALANFFRPGNLGALRELALLWVADRVEEHLGEYLDQHGLDGAWEIRERVVVGLTGAPGADAVVRRAARISQRVGGELFGVHVTSPDAWLDHDDDGLGHQLALLQSLGGAHREVVGDDPAVALVAMARNVHATQIVIGATRESRWRQTMHGSFATRLSRLASDIDVHIVANDTSSDRTIAPSHRGTRHDPRRSWVAVALFAAGLPALTATLRLFDERIGLSTKLLVLLVLVIAVATIGGRAIATAAAFASALVANWFFVEPRHTLSIDSIDDVVALVVFVVVGLVVGALADRIATQAAEANRSRAEAAILARTAAMLAADPDPVGRLLGAVIDAFDLAGARLVHSEAGREDQIVATAGDPTAPELTIEISPSPTGDRRTLIVGGRALNADDQRVLAALAGQLGVAIDRQVMRQDVRRARELSAIDNARTALLRAVSHDLRTPLATIKALSSGLLDRSITWQPAQLAEMHATIDEETDRLNRLIGNLLDASRLESGTLAVDAAPVELHEVVAAAIASLTHRPAGLHVDIPATIPPTLADRSLLERAIANLIDNATRYSPADAPVAITAAQLGNELHLCVIDRGPGIPSSRHVEVLSPFQRLDDTGTDGVGLGLAIVDGFVRAMDGALILDDTPGGGLTATVVLPVAPADPFGIDSGRVADSLR
jgi:two-component system, OmpR family, sensor histidine kinase KdpD